LSPKIANELLSVVSEAIYFNLKFFEICKIYMFPISILI
jgi:hypothetical protein